ncbi:MAG: hypothetical protein WA364_28005 [Candidatus Nitrosopolaris sp.]
MLQITIQVRLVVKMSEIVEVTPLLLLRKHHVTLLSTYTAGLLFLTNFPLMINTTIDVPTKVADQ